jgi:hypothetical protein
VPAEVVGDVRLSACSPVLLPLSKRPPHEIDPLRVGRARHPRPTSRKTGLPIGPQHAGWNKRKGVRPAKAGMFIVCKSHRGKSKKTRSLGNIRGGNESGEAD